MDILKNLLGVILQIFSKKQLKIMPVIDKNTFNENIKKQYHEKNKISNRDFNQIRWK